MEISVISEETIKPSASVYDFEPFKLCFLDQLVPIDYYSPLILFFTSNDHAHNLGSSQISDQLKLSLSKALSSFYPLAGTLKDNCRLHNFQKGAQFLETRVKGRLDNFLHNPQIKLLNHLLPFQPFYLLKDTTFPQLSVQLNVFDCGGIAIGMCFSHKIMDAATGVSFVKNWAANARGSSQEVEPPNLIEASLWFPPLQVLPPFCDSFLDSWWTSEAKVGVRRFVFDADAVDTLKAKAKSEAVKYPTRSEVLSAFIWKSAMAASKLVSGYSRPSLFTQIVNLRRLTQPPLPSSSVGNLFLQPNVRYDPAQAEPELHELVALARNCVRKINDEGVGEGSEAIFKHLVQMETSKGDEISFNFSDLRTFHWEEVDFGWGKPVWVALCGQGQDSNCTLFMNGKKGAIEAWMMLDEKIMAKLEQDLEFLAFASPNPSLI